MIESINNFEKKPCIAQTYICEVSTIPHFHVQRQIRRQKIQAEVEGREFLKLLIFPALSSVSGWWSPDILKQFASLCASGFRNKKSLGVS